MIKIEDHCRSCATEAYPCRGKACPFRRVRVHYCDKCGRELSEYEITNDDIELCDDCLEGEEEEE